MAERNVTVAYQVMEFLCVSLRVCDRLWSVKYCWMENKQDLAQMV
jgi:hypothetical protein